MLFLSLIYLSKYSILTQNGYKMNINNIKTSLKIYFLAVLVFTFFRVVLFFSAIEKLGDNYNFWDIIGAFLMGLRFDIVISSYLLLVPFILMTLNLFYNRFHSSISNILRYFLLVCFSLAFLVCAADIPFFHQFFTRFNVTAFEWMNTPLFVLKMIFEEPSYWLYILPLIFVIYLFNKGLKWAFKDKLTNSKKQKYILEFLLSFVFFLFMLLGIRGRTEIKSPIRVGTAYFCNNAFLNKLGLNPNYTLIRSYLDSRKQNNKHINLMNGKLAISNVRGYFHINTNNKLNPLLRFENYIPDSVFFSKPNIIIVIMESMSAGKMARHGDKHNLTPFLDSLSRVGYYFENTYSAGIHTYNGIFSTLFSFPALFKQHSMKNTPILEYSGLPYSLDNLGYSSIFFMTHDG